MNGRCQKIQHILAESGATAFQDDASAQQHLADCADCYAVLTALSELDAAIPALPIHDAADACVDTLLARVRDLPPPKSEAPPAARQFVWRVLEAVRSASDRRLRLVGSAATVAVVSAACVAIVVRLVDLETDFPSLAERSATDSALVVRKPEVDTHGSSNDPELELKKRLLSPNRERFAAESIPIAQQLEALGYGGVEIAAPVQLAEEPVPHPAVPGAQAAAIEEILVTGETRDTSLADAPTSSTSFSADDLEISDIADLPVPFSLEANTEFDADSALEGDEAALSKRDDRPTAAKKSATMEDLRGREKSGWKDEGAEAPDAESEIARFRFQPASGYWSNAYVPGDPAIRLLESRLKASDRAMLEANASTPLRLHDRARQVQQPFDAPAEAAMQVFLHSDHTAIEGPERLTLQIGLQGARRQGGTRPPMNIGVLLDLRGEISAGTATQMRAVVDAFRQAREVGDRFSLWVAGRDCTGVAPDRFAYGPLSVAMESCFGADADPGQGEAIASALESAIQAVRESDDPDAPLGSSMVLLVTSQRLGGHLTALEAIAHESAVAGVPLSVAGVGSDVSLDEIDRLTLAGQGNRRFVTTADDAREAVDRELSALSRAVARALRLRIRLAPGVELIRVLDATRLDDDGAERVRETEQSIDLRMASELGIQADRGEDEDGIQIVIPSFYAGDSHAVLLDVVAREAGPIADVTLRYKDLIYQRNGVARANLVLGGDARSPGPLERNVLKNVLSIRISSALESAGRALEEGRLTDATRTLDEQRTHLLKARESEPAFQSDAELQADLELLDEYLSLLSGEAVGLEGSRRYLAASLQLAGHFKVLPRTRAQ